MEPGKARRLTKGRCAVWTAVSHPEVGFEGNRPPLEQLYENYYVPGNMLGDSRGLILSGFGAYYGTYGISPEEQNKRYEWIVELTRRNEEQ